jgi:tetratricopeptide (TPR) repeat protein
MNQLVVLQEIYESFSKGGVGLHSIDPKSIEGNCSVILGQLLEGFKQGKTDAKICLTLSDCLQDVFEVKRLGDICKKAGLLEVAIRCYDRAHSMTGDKSVKAVLLNNLGQVYMQFGDLGRATAYYTKATKRFECIGDKSGLAHVLGNLGSVYRKGRDWDKAVEYCHKSLKIFEELHDDLGAAQMTGSLGRIYAEMGEVDLATRHFEKSLKDFQILGDRKSEAWVLYRLGKIYSYRSMDASLKYYNKSLSIFEDLSQGQSSGIVLSSMGLIYLDKGEASKARDYLERSLSLLRKDMKPAFHNASSWLAATYSSLAKDHQNRTTSSSSSGILTGPEIEDQLTLASQYYSRASDRYRVLLQMPKVEFPDLSAAAGIATFLSVLSLLMVEKKDEEAVKLTEKAISCLEEITLTGTIEVDQIEAIVKDLIALKSVWSQSTLNKEPWKTAKSLADSIGYLIGGTRIPGGAGVCIQNALSDLRSAMDDEQQRRDSSDHLKSVSSNLRQAESRLSIEGVNREISLRLKNAAELIEKLIRTDADPTKSSSPNINDLLNYRSHRNAIVQIGWAQIISALPSIDKTSRIYVWDEFMNLVENRSVGQPRAGQPELSKIKPTWKPTSANNVISIENEFVDSKTPETQYTTSHNDLGDEKVAIEMDSKGSLFADEPIADAIPVSFSLVPVTSRFVSQAGSHGTENKTRGQSKGKDYGKGPAENANTCESEDPFDLAWKKLKDSASSFGGANKKFAFGNRFFNMPKLLSIVKILALIVASLLVIDVILYLI